MRTLQVNGVGLRVSRYSTPIPDEPGPDPQPPVVVFVHGLMVDHSGLGFTLGMPLSRGAEVVLYDLRGHGRSQPVRSGYRVADHVADLMALLDELGLRDPVHLVGGSYGGAVVVRAALDRPDRVASLSLIEGLVPHEGWGALVARVLERAAEGLRGEVTADQAMAVLGFSSARRALGVARRARQLILETTLLEDVSAEAPLGPEAYAMLSCPVLGIYGDRSDIYPVTELLREAPAAEIRTVPDADHVGVFWHTRLLKTLIGEHVGVTPPMPVGAPDQRSVG